MKKHKIKMVSLLPAALLLLLAVSVPAMAEKGMDISAKAATPSNMVKEDPEVLPGTAGTVLTGAEITAETAAAAPAAEVPKKGAVITSEDLAGTWTIDGVTSYQFKKGTTGALILPEHKYAFKYTLEENELTLKFESAKIKKAVFQVSLEGDTLIFEKEEAAGTAEFVLEKVKD